MAGVPIGLLNRDAPAQGLLGHREMPGLLGGLLEALTLHGDQVRAGRQARHSTAMDRPVLPSPVQGLLNMAMFPGRVWRGEVDPASDEAIGWAADMAGSMTLGAGAIPAEANALRMGISHITPKAKERILVRQILDPSSPHDAAVVWDNGIPTIRRTQDWGYWQSDLRDFVINSAMEHAFPVPRPNEFWRLTNNPKEIDLLRSGKLNVSRNHAGGSLEDGLSVSPNPLYAMHGYKYAYKVRGEYIGTGSDGEPLLRLDTLEPLTPLRNTTAVEAEYRREVLAHRKQLKARLGISNDTLEAIANSKFDIAPLSKTGQR